MAAALPASRRAARPEGAGRTAVPSAAVPPVADPTAAPGADPAAPPVADPAVPGTRSPSGEPSRVAPSVAGSIMSGIYLGRRRDSHIVIPAGADLASSQG